MGLTKSESAALRAGQPVVVSREQAAELLGGVAVGTIVKWAATGELERIFLGRRSMIVVSSIEAMIRRARAAAAGRGKAEKPVNLVKAEGRAAETRRRRRRERKAELEEIDELDELAAEAPAAKKRGRKQGGA
jgi:hypothetical protein